MTRAPVNPNVFVKELASGRRGAVAAQHPAAAQAAADQAAGPDPKDEEINSLKKSLRGKDDQIKALNEEKAKLAADIADLQKEANKWRAMALSGR